MLAVLVGMTGLVGDVSVWFAQRRALQSAVDSAALAAAPWAADPTTALAKAQQVLKLNDSDATITIDKLQTGYYCPDTSVSSSLRFQTTQCQSGSVAVNPNAVRIQASMSTSRILSRILVSSSTAEPSITVNATAARINQAGVEAGSALAKLDTNLSNAMLTMLAGGTINVTAADYDGLATAHINVLPFLDTLATRLNLTAGTYDQLLSTNVSVSTVLQAAVDVLGQQSQVAGASAAAAGLQLIQQQVPGSPTIKLGDLIDLGLWDKSQVGDPQQSPAALEAGINAFQFATAVLQLANGQHAASASVPLAGYSGISNVTIQSAAVEKPVNGYFGFGPEGVTVHTAAVRLQLTATVTNATLISILGTSSVPLYVEVASGDAGLSAISCSGTPSIDATVKASAQSHGANIYLGTAPSNLFTDFTQTISYANLTPMQIANLSIAGVATIKGTAKANVGVAQSSQSTLTYVQPANTSAAHDGVIGDPLGSTPVTAGVQAGNFASGLGGLYNNVQVTASSCLGLLGTTLICPVNSTYSGSQISSLTSPLQTVFTSLDTPINNLLQAAGVEIARLDVAITGVKCGVPVLVT